MTIADLKRRVPVAMPVMAGNERAYVNDCLDRNWITAGKYERAFEQAWAQFCGTRHAVACSSGTAALHLALTALGIGPDDEVIVPSLTFAATGFAPLYCGARPVVVDVDPDSWCLDPEAVRAAMTPRTKAVIAVHLYGRMAAMDALRDLCERYGVALVEDAAEAHGGSACGRRAGALGRVGCFSFYGNKILTTGEGGAVTTDDPELAERVRLLRGQGMQGHSYWHPVVGFNYRMGDLAAAVGLAQIERADELLKARRDVAASYLIHLPGGVMPQPPAEGHAWWMVAVTVDNADADRVSRVREALKDRGVETRPVFPPLHKQPPLASWQPRPIAEDIATRGIVLPTHAGMTRDDVRYVCSSLAEALACT